VSYAFHYDMPIVAPKGASELFIQKQCRSAVAKCIDAETWAVPNAGKRTRWAAGRAKAEGLKPGAPDLLIVGGKRNPGRIAFIEIKAKSHLSDEQKAVLTDLAAAGHNCGVFRSPGTLIDKMREWGWQ
jgi:hypothetical protein